jgi:ATP-dependent RNA helicase DDX49/DBP8
MGKRKSLTADDLLRQQEGPQKRFKSLLHSSRPSDSGGEDSGTSADEDDLSSDNDAHEDTDETDEETSQGNLLQESRADSSGSRLTIKPRTDHNPNARPPASTTFSGLGISASLQSALTSMSIRTPTEVQAACIPPLLQGKQITLVFLLLVQNSFGRTRLHRKCENWLWKDDRICPPNPSEAFC